MKSRRFVVWVIVFGLALSGCGVYMPAGASASSTSGGSDTSSSGTTPTTPSSSSTGGTIVRGGYPPWYNPATQIRTQMNLIPGG